MSEIQEKAASKTEGAQLVRWEAIPPEQVNALFTRQIVVNDQIMFARLELKKGCVVPMHSHFNEQVSQILNGALEFTLEGKQIVVRGGEILCIPPDVPHGAVAIEDTVAIDFFNPPREDWLNKTDQYLRR